MIATTIPFSFDDEDWRRCCCSSSSTTTNAQFGWVCMGRFLWTQLLSNDAKKHRAVDDKKEWREEAFGGGITRFGSPCIRVFFVAPTHSVFLKEKNSGCDVCVRCVQKIETKNDTAHSLQRCFYKRCVAQPLFLLCLSLFHWIVFMEAVLFVGGSGTKKRIAMQKRVFSTLFIKNEARIAGCSRLSKKFLPFSNQLQLDVLTFCSIISRDSFPILIFIPSNHWSFRSRRESVCVHPQRNFVFVINMLE